MGRIHMGKIIRDTEAVTESVINHPLPDSLTKKMGSSASRPTAVGLLQSGSQIDEIREMKSAAPP